MLLKIVLNIKLLSFLTGIIKKKAKLLKKLGVKTYKISVNKNGDLDLKKALIKARKLGFSRIFLESGLKLAGNFLKENLVNDLKFFISNEMLNKNGNGSIREYFTTLLKKKFKVEKVNLFGEKLISCRIK